MIPVPLLLETMSKILKGNAVKGHQRFLLNLCNANKMTPFQILIHPWEQKKKVAMRETERVVEVGCNRHFVFSQKESILLLLQRFEGNRWWPLTAFSLKISDNASSSGSGAGIAGSSHRGEYCEWD